MKFALLALLALIASAESFAQYRPRPAGDRDRDGIPDRREREFSTREGRRIVRINIGDEDERDDRIIRRRIRDLEEAVRDLQDKVYDLETQPVIVAPPVARYESFCTGNFFGISQPVNAKAPTELEARTSVLGQCRQLTNRIFCEDRSVKCNRSQIQ